MELLMLSEVRARRWTFELKILESFTDCSRLAVSVIP